MSELHAITNCNPDLFSKKVVKSVDVQFRRQESTEYHCVVFKLLIACEFDQIGTAKLLPNGRQTNCD